MFPSDQSVGSLGNVVNELGSAPWTLLLLLCPEAIASLAKSAQENQLHAIGTETE